PRRPASEPLTQRRTMFTPKNAIVFAAAMAGLLAMSRADEPNAKVAKTPAPPKAAPDPKVAAEIDKRMQEFLSQPPDRLAAATREAGLKTLASLECDRPLAQLRTRDALLVKAREEGLTQ